MDIKTTDLKFTDQIDRELVQRFATQASAFGNPSNALAQSGPWLTAVAVAIAATIWVLLTH